jgi:hypothetical protein
VRVRGGGGDNYYSQTPGKKERDDKEKREREREKDIAQVARIVGV